MVRRIPATQEARERAGLKARWQGISGGGGDADGLG